jgi:hypothetical protein
MKWRQSPTARLDVTPVRAEGSLTVTEGLVVAVYGLYLVEARPAIYVIHPLDVARVDQVVAVASVDLVVAFARDDLVVALAAPRLPLRRSAPARALRLSSPSPPVRRSFPAVPMSVSSPPVPVKTFVRASWPAKSAPTTTTITVSKMCSRFIRLPYLVYMELVLLVFSSELFGTL